MSTTSEEEEAANTASGTGGRGRPNAYFADQTEGVFGSNYRAVPAPGRGGAASVKPEDTLGDLEHCWCGQPAGHSWPGKAQHAPHPKGNATMSAITKSMLKGYHVVLQEFIIAAVNEFGLSYRIRDASVVLFPLDGSKPTVVWQKVDEQQIHKLVSWWRAHVEPHLPEGMAPISITTPDRKAARAARKAANPQPAPLSDAELEAAAAKLAARLAGPEHEAPKAKPEPKTEPVKVEVPKPAPPKSVPAKVEVVEEPVADVADLGEQEWYPYTPNRGEVSDYILTNGEKRFRCSPCAAEGKVFESHDSRGIAGHFTLVHNEETRTKAFAPDTRARAGETLKRVHRDKKIEEGVLAIAAAIGLKMDDSAETAKLQARIDSLTKQLDAANAELAKMKAAADDATARLALIKESLTA